MKIVLLIFTACIFFGCSKNTDATPPETVSLYVRIDSQGATVVSDAYVPSQWDVQGKYIVNGDTLSFSGVTYQYQPVNAPGAKVISAESDNPVITFKY